MVIAVCGYGSSGASAVTDFLKGYENIQVVPFEFQILHQTDGLSDLKYHLVVSRERVSCNAAIYRFKRLMFNSIEGTRLRKLVGSEYDNIVNRFLSKIILIEWNGRSNYDPTDVSDRSKYRFIQYIQRGLSYVFRKINVNWHYPSYRTRYFSILEETEFDKAAKSFLKELFRAFGGDFKDNLVLDMALSAINPIQGAELIEDIKIISVSRDPRDTYICCCDEDYINRFMPREPVNSFVVFYRTIMNRTVWDSRCLNIRYEDMIYNYKETTDDIIKYLGLEKRPDNEFVYFNPNISVKYTNFFRTHPEYIKDIKYIEEELSEFLYDFCEYKPMNINIKYNGGIR